MIDVYRLEGGKLAHVVTLREGDTLTSPLLPGMDMPLARIFAGLPSEEAPKVSQPELASAVGWSVRALSDYETGGATDIKATRLGQVLRVLKGSAEEALRLAIAGEEARQLGFYAPPTHERSHMRGKQCVGGKGVEGMTNRRGYWCEQ